MFDWLKQKLGWGTEAAAGVVADTLPTEAKVSPAAPEAPGTTMTGGRKRRHRTKRHGKRRHHTRRR